MQAVAIGVKRVMKYVGGPNVGSDQHEQVRPLGHGDLPRLDCSLRVYGRQAVPVVNRLVCGTAGMTHDR